MNAKEEVLEMLNIKKHELKERFEKLYDSAKKEESKFKIANVFASQNKKINHLITAVENAIFDVPSEDEMHIDIQDMQSYDEFIQYLRNYKKPETDGK